MNSTILDFEQARAKHLLFKSKLRSILHGLPVEEAPVLSEFDCGVGKWIYGFALEQYGHIAEMQELERVHAKIHFTARNLVDLYNEGKVEEARKHLTLMEDVADHLVSLLTKVESLVVSEDKRQLITGDIEARLVEFQSILNANIELDKRVKEQVQKTTELTERYQLVQKATQDAVWDWNLKTQIILWNEGFEDLFGYQFTESNSEFWISKIHPEDRERVRVDIYGLIDRKGDKWESEYRFLKADNTYAAVYDRGFIQYNNEGNAQRFVGAMQDLTRLKRYEQKLLFSEDRFNTLIDTLEEGITLHDLSGKITLANKSAHTLLGLTMDEMTGRNALDPRWKAIHEDGSDYPGEMHPPHLAITTLERQLEKVMGIHHINGNLVWVQINSSPLFDPQSGELLGAVTSFIDITARKKYAQQKDDFVSTVSHELKTPVTSIKAFAQFLQRSLIGEENSRNKSLLNRMDIQVNRLETLIKDLLDVTRLDNGKLAFRPITFNFNELVEELIADLQLVCSSHQLLILNNEVLEVYTDKERMIQVITNLVSNAIKYSTNAETINISIYKKDSNLLFGVQDYGIGIPEEQHAYIFERFHQVEKTNQNAGLTLGLGLYISKEIIKRAGGEIWLESEVGKGSTFWFSLPL